MNKVWYDSGGVVRTSRRWDEIVPIIQRSRGRSGEVRGEGTHLHMPCKSLDTGTRPQGRVQAQPELRKLRRIPHEPSRSRTNDQDVMHLEMSGETTQVQLHAIAPQSCRCMWADRTCEPTASSSPIL